MDAHLKKHSQMRYMSFSFVNSEVSLSVYNLVYGLFFYGLSIHCCSGQYAWQTLIAYDACIRLCLHAWARGCTEAPEFLLDECLLLRSAFG